MTAYPLYLYGRKYETTLEQVQEILELVNKYGIKEIQAPATTNIENSILSQQPSLIAILVIVISQ